METNINTTVYLFNLEFLRISAGIIPEELQGRAPNDILAKCIYARGSRWLPRLNESDGSARDLSKDPLLDLESDHGWLCLSDHDNLSDDETEIESPPGSQQVTSNGLDQPLDSGPQPVIEADSNTSDGKLEKPCTMLHRHEPVFLKFSQESPRILVNSVSATKDLMQLIILVNKTNEYRAAEAKR
ncbi:uncharacterized protein FTJAE_6561 [Fusarium tjaetaba]|uniref:Uncharacterized protein n=1 Tax=Fusarium tjaetaba TaxID=1567544 RepID=A0A8H5VTC9_9HYPO|nr:uncharacterized protein FTJAE_6561 [Fusarium tjaetaba]KAF5634891.1 hypothetical protein FTJAE_6561 [Fusarium tjaetaba]